MERPTPRGALIGALLAISFAAATARAQEGGGPAAPPESAFDVEEYARGLVLKAKEYAEAKDWGRALGYLRYVRQQLAGARYVREHAEEIEQGTLAAEDGVAEGIFAAATAAAEKNPAGAKAPLARLRKDFAETRFFAKEREKIEALEARVRTAIWPGKSAFRGEATLPAEGVVRLAYRFEKIEVLGDFDAGATTPPKVEGGRLAAGRAGAVVRHRLAIAEGATFTAEVEAHGSGRLALVLEGEEAAAETPARALVLEALASAKSVRISFRRGEKAVSPEIESPRASAADAWKVRVERKNGRLTASSGDGAPLEAESPGAAAPVKLGIAFQSGKVEVASLVLEAPLGADAEAARPPLPRHVWIPLAKGGLAAWKPTVAGKWAVDDNTLRADLAGNAILAKETEGRALDRYEFRAEVRIEAKGTLGVEPLFTVVLPVGKLRVAWTFDNREMRIDGVDVRYLGMPAPGTWQPIAAKVGPQGVEAFLGGQRVLSVPIEKIVSSPRTASLDGLGFIAQSARRRLELRDPKIRVE